MSVGGGGDGVLDDGLLVLDAALQALFQIRQVPRWLNLVLYSSSATSFQIRHAINYKRLRPKS